MARRAHVAALLAGLACLPAAPAVAHETGRIPAPKQRSPSSGARASAAPASCPGDPISPTKVIVGELERRHQGSYVLVPFDVPAGTTAVRVKYCHDQPETPLGTQLRHTLDLGLYDARRAPGRPHGPPEFRGWGGSSHPDVTVSREGFSSEGDYRRSPRGRVPGKTTRGFRPGAIQAGEWAVELGAASVISQAEGDLDGKVAWRVEIELSEDKRYADEPYRPAEYDPRAARREPGWYAGDFHVHAEHSALGDATMSEAFDYAFRPLASGGAGLDFVTLSDYVTDTAWGEIGRYRDRHPGKLAVRSAEVITYRGHANNHASGRFVDYRTGPLIERRDDGRLEQVRGMRSANDVLGDVRAAGGFTQINHPTIFPSDVPGFAALCRGCPWDHADTDYGKVDAIEVATGPAGVGTLPGEPVPSPFALSAVDFYERALRRGHKIAAVGSSDSHHAGRAENPLTQTPIGEATTVVYADELSEKGVQRAVEHGSTYVKLFGNDGPDLRLEARAPGHVPAIMGETMDAEGVEFEARVIGAPQNEAPLDLVVVKDGAPLHRVPVTSADFRHSFRATGGGRYRLQLQRLATIHAVSSPIYVGPRTPLIMKILSRRRLAVSGGAFVSACAVSGTDVRSCRAELLLTPRKRRGRSRARLVGSGSALVTGGEATPEVRLTRAGRRALRRRPRGLRGTLRMTVVDREGLEETVAERVTLRGRRAARRRGGR